MGLFTRKRELLVLFSSPHSHGCTRKLLESFLECFRENDLWEITELDLYQLNVRPCVACGACAKKEGCAFDDFDGIDREIRESDLLVVASPVHHCTFPSPMLAVLGRTQRYFEARFSLGIKSPIKKARKAVLLLTMGSQEDFAVEVTTYQLNRAFSVMNTELAGCAVWDATDLGEQKKGEAQQKARALCRFVNDV